MLLPLMKILVILMMIKTQLVMTMMLMKILVILTKTQLVMVFGTKFLPLSSTELACNVAATDEDPSDTGYY